MITCGVVVATFGSMAWRERGQEAAASAYATGADQVIVHHGSSLADARNIGLMDIETDYVCFLDADDRLDPLYFTAFRAFVDRDRDLLYQPQVALIDRPSEPPVTLKVRDIRLANSLVIGTVAPTALVKSVGGFDHALPILEDWDLWIRCVMAGAGIRQCPGMIYWVGKNDAPRNADKKLGQAIAIQLRRKYKDMPLPKEYLA